MSILFAGTPGNAAVTLRELVSAGTPITLVLTRPDARTGRKAILTPSPVALVAEELGIPTIKSNSVDENVIDQLHGIEFAIVVAFGALLKKEALSSLPKGWFNLHYSLLPKWRGAAPVQWSIISNEQETGVTLFKIDEGLDTGPIVSQVPSQIQPGETGGELLSRLTHLGVSLLLEQLPLIDAQIAQTIEQPESGTSAPKLTRADGQIDFTKDLFLVDALIRGVTPEPGAWTNLNGESFKIYEAKPTTEINAEIGTLKLVGERLVVGCANGSLELLEVQPSGKTRMRASDWYRGLQNKEIRLGMNV